LYIPKKPQSFHSHKEENLKNMMKRFEGWVVDKFYGGKVVKDVVIACLEQDMLEDLMFFLNENAERFLKSTEQLAPGEHSLENSSIHQEYVKLIEDRLSKPLKRHGKTVEEFFEICLKIQNAGHAEEIEPFIRVVLAASDFLLFSDIMSDEGKRSYFFIILRGLQNQFKRELKAEQSNESGETDEGKVSGGSHGSKKNKK
jgi:hypothetical protein